MYACLHKSPNKNKRYRMVFKRSKDQATTYTDFGSNMENYTIHHDEKRKKNYLSRFRKLIDRYKDNPQAPTTLSTMLLWAEPTLEESFQNYLHYFHLSGKIDFKPKRIK